MDNFNLTHYLKHNILLESISEAEIKDDKLKEQIKEFADLSDEIDKITSQLKKLKNQYDVIEDVLRPVLEELEETKEKALEIDDILVTIKRKGFDRTSYAYKDAFDWLKERVNPAMKKIVEEALEKTKKTSRITSKLGVQRNISENKITSALKSAWLSFKNKLSSLNSKLGTAITSFKSKMEK